MKIENPILYNIWKDRYQKNNETIEDNIRRVAKYIALNKSEEEEFFNVMNEGLFLPAGRTMSNSGIGNKLTLNNCFTLNFVEDNIEDIFEKVKMGAITQKVGGGTGYEFSKIRPNGSPTSNDAIASGVVSFMNVFNAQTSCILQGGRRGANMSVLSIRHPDIYEYIEAKSYEEGKLIHFNMSVMVDDEFMIAVEKDDIFNLHFPIYDDKGFIIKDKNKWITNKEIKARDLWNLIMQKAYDNGEPGVLFYENMNDDNNTYYMENIVNTNPCFTGDMKLLTTEGYKTFEELNNSQPNIININGEVSNSKVWCSGEKETIKLTLTNGKEITCTPNHKFMTIDGDECEAINLKNIKLMPKLTNTFKPNNLYVKLGFIQGDGSLSRLDSDAHKGLEVNIGFKDGDIFDLFSDEAFTNKSNRAIYLSNYKNILNELEFSHEILPYRIMPSTYKSWNYIDKASFLQGCYSANGSVITGKRVSYKTTCKEFAIQLMRTLEEDFNITPNLTTNKKHKVLFSNGEYECRESYDVNINKYSDIVKFHEYIGFYQQYKKVKLQKLILEKTPYVRSIESNGIHKVYDFTEPLTHWGIVEGFVVHNCGEYLSGVLYDNIKLNSEEYKGACNLGSLFLHNFVVNPFTTTSHIDYDRLSDTIKIAVRILDNIIDINKFPHKHYENYQKSLRTIGMGITGLADCMCMLGIKYGSNESISFVDDLMNFIVHEAYKYSALLAKEKGSFPSFNKDKYIQSAFIQKHYENYSDWNDIIELIQNYGMRNARLISIAPTGTLSLTYGNNCSSGLEPIFSLEYDRKVKIGGQSDDDIQIVKMQDYAYKLWKSNKNNIVSKDVFVTAMDLPVKSHLDILSKVAYHTDMSCSKTINVPTDYPFEDCKDIYTRAWKEGIKGCTIFRPNEIRQGILITDNEQEQIKHELNRGEWKPLAEDTIYAKKSLNIGCGKLKLFIGYSPLENKIQDLYIKKAGQGGCTHNLEAVAVALSAVYRLGGSTHNIEKAFSGLGGCNSFLQARMSGKTLSKGSSCATAILNIINEFEKELNLKPISNKIIKDINDNKLNLSKDESTFLEEYGEIAFAKHYNKCPICGEQLSNDGGCLTCVKGCGWTKCE